MGKFKHIGAQVSAKNSKFAKFSKSSCLGLCKESETVSIHLFETAWKISLEIS